MSKRRGFDIDFPAGTETPAEEEFPRGPEGYYTGGGRAKPGASRRGPMAAAISENAEALRDRAEAERAIREENDRLAHDYVRLKRAGLITDLVPIDAVLTTKLTRDRAAGPDPEIEELKASIREVGLSNPIRASRTWSKALSAVKSRSRSRQEGRDSAPQPRRPVTCSSESSAGIGAL